MRCGSSPKTWIRNDVLSKSELGAQNYSPERENSILRARVLLDLQIYCSGSQIRSLGQWTCWNDTISWVARVMQPMPVVSNLAQVLESRFIIMSEPTLKYCDCFCLYDLCSYLSIPLPQLQFDKLFKYA